MQLEDQVYNFVLADVPLVPVKSYSDGNRAAPKGWEKATQSIDNIVEPRFTEYVKALGKDIGVVIPKWFIVIDVDPDSFEEEDNPFQRLSSEFKLEGLIDKTLTVRTPSRGMHIYLRLTPEQIERGSNNLFNSKVYKGVEILRIGKRVSLPMSIRRMPDGSKEVYKYVGGSISALATCPDDLFNHFYRVPSSADRGYEASEADLKKFRLLARNREPAIEGQGGDTATYSLACRGFDMGLDQYQIYEVMSEEFNPRCQPPWRADELMSKVVNAREYNQNTAGQDSSFALFGNLKLDLGERKDKATWDTDRHGKLKNTIQNIINFLSEKHISGKENPIADLFAYCEFQRKVVVVGRPPWIRAKKKKNLFHEPYGKKDGVQLKLYLNRFWGMHPTIQLIDEAVLADSMRQTVNPLTDYLDSIQWDGVPRLDYLIKNALTLKPGAVGTEEYSAHVLRNFFISAVLRAYVPGSKVDEMPILEGREGIGKSRVVKAIGKEFFSDHKLDLGFKRVDTIAAFAKVWIYEFAELSTLDHTRVEDMKLFLTQSEDVARFAYGHDIDTIPRNWVAIGTTNPKPRGYLTSRTGNRRFLPVVVEDINVPYFEDYRDQLFAEAKHLWEKGHKWYLDSRMTEKAREIQQSKVIKDPWEEDIIGFIETNTFKSRHDFITIDSIATDLLGIQLKAQNNAVSGRIANILIANGYKQIKVHSKNGKHFREAWTKKEGE